MDPEQIKATFDDVSCVLSRAVLEFAVVESEQEAQAQSRLPCLKARISANGRSIEGHHTGERTYTARSDGQGFQITASGTGSFISSEMAFGGQFAHSKLHDTSGSAVCYFNPHWRLIGVFGSGRCHGVLEKHVDGCWQTALDGKWSDESQGSACVETAQDLTLEPSDNDAIGVGAALVSVDASLPVPPKPSTQPTTATSEATTAVVPPAAGSKEDLLSRLDLLSAVTSGDASILLSLHQLGALGTVTDINQLFLFKADYWDEEVPCSALAIACAQGHLEVVQVLLLHPHIEPDQLTGMGTTAFFIAAEHGHSEVVRALLKDSRANVNLLVDHTALTKAISNGHTETALVLLADGRVDVNLRSDAISSPLIMATINDQSAVVTALLANRSTKTNCQDRQGRTALMWAFHYNRTGILHALLLDARVDVNVKDNEGRTVLMQVMSGHTSALPVLLAHQQIDVNLQDLCGQTALMMACGGRVEKFRTLLTDSRTNPNLLDKQGLTVLMIAVEQGRTDWIEALLSNSKIDVNVQNKEGNSALMLASSSGDNAAVFLLLADGRIDVNLKNKFGQTALINAANEEIKAMLVTKGATN